MRDVKVGIISGALAIGGMEIGACRLARVLADLGYRPWIAFNGLEAAGDHPIGDFLAADGLDLLPWASVLDMLADTEVIWVSQGGFLDGTRFVEALNRVPWRFEYNGQPASVVPEHQGFVPTWHVVKTASLTREMKERRKDDVAGFLTIPGIPVPVPKRLDRKPASPPMFFSMSRMVDWQKRLGVAIQAAHHLNTAGVQFRLVLAGDGPQRRQYEQLARGAAYIEFPGWVTGTQRDDLARKATAYVMPSLWEGSSRALREMMALGVPIIAGRGGGTEEVVRDQQDAVLLDVSGDQNTNLGQNAATLAGAMQWMIENPDRARALAKSARQRVRWLNARATRQIGAWMKAIRDERILPLGAVDVSVIIPAHNAGATLEATVASVLGQEAVDGYALPSYEIVICDDASTDATRAIADAFATNDGRITAIHLAPIRDGEPNGVNAARNRAALASRGRALLPLDADDELLGTVQNGKLVARDWLARAWAAYMEGGGECLVYGRVVRRVPPSWRGGMAEYDAEGQVVSKIIYPSTFVENARLLMGGDRSRGRTLLPTVLHPRRAWACVGGWRWEGGADGGVGRGLEDSAYNIELLLAGYTLKYMPDIYYHWRWRPDSRSSKMNFRKEWEALVGYYSQRLQEVGYGL